MAKSCVYAPKKGVKTFYKLEKEFGYDLAWKIYGTAINSKFKNAYKDTLSLDTEGIPSFESLMQNEIILGLIGSKLKPMIRRNFPSREDTIANYNLTIEDAKRFNKESPYNRRFTAVAAYDDKGDLIVDLVPKTKENDKKFASQYSTFKLNQAIARILAPLGVSIELLSDIEQRSGRVGVTDFSKAKDIAKGVVSMIRVSNNREGAEALSEEFAHILVRALRANKLVQRNINALTNEDSLKQILGDSYQDVYDFYDGDLELVAEEALGHILQSELLKNYKDQDNSLLGRLIRFIQRQFKGIKESLIGDAITNAELGMSDLARGIFDGTQRLTKSDIANSQRNIQFNALSDRVERNIKILKDALNTEVKRYRISRNDKVKDYAADISQMLKAGMKNEDTTLGVLTYAKEALNSLKSSYRQLADIDSVDPRSKFKIILGVRSTIQSYGGFIEQLNDAAIEEESEEENDFLRDIEITDYKGHTTTINTKETLEELNNAYKGIARKYLKVAIPAFAEYLRPILGDEITLELGDKAGTKVTIEKLLTQSEGDISFLDRWLDSMGNSSDILLRAFDRVYKQAMDKARLKSIHDFRRIQQLRMEAESYGINTFNWMFEKDSEGNLTGDYISEININQYNKDYNDFIKYLNDKYGERATWDNVNKKLAERTEWFRTHTKLTIFGERVPNEALYRNKDFDKLTDKQKLIREKFLKLKEEMDFQYPSNRVSTLKAIQLRKNGVQRFIDSASSPSSILSNIKEHLAEEFLERTDDDQIFGSKRSGLTDFAGREFMVLPVLFTTRLENPNDLSTDIFGSLMAYTSASNNYQALDNIIDPLEVGRSIVIDSRKVKSTRGGMNVFEKFGALGKQVQNYVYEGGGSNIEKRLDDFFESQLYHRYFKDSGIWNLGSLKANKNKVVSALTKGSSLASLGFNYLSNLANVLTGIGMQNIEAAAGEFFNARELAKADKIYLSNIASVLGELGSRTKTNTLSLFDELFNIRQNFERVSENSLRKSVLARLFNSDIAYLGQAGGDHWLYNRTAIAMALREKVNIPGKGTMSLWDALQIVDTFENNNSLKDMILPEGTTDANGKPFDIGAFSRKVAHVNQTLFGIYNSDDRNAAQRVIAGRLLLQFRNWMKPQFNRRFKKAQLNLDTGTTEEGYYKTVWRILIGLYRGQYQLGAVFETLNNSEKANIRRAITEMVQLLAVVALVNLVEWPDDKDRPWALKLAEYSAKRLEHELGNLAPSPIMLQEMLKTVKSPAASINQVQNLTNLVISTLTPTDWVTEAEGGTYKGMTILERNLYNSGLPIISQYKQFNRMIYDMGNSIYYYARPY